MAIIAGKAGYGLIIALFSLSLSGCGLTQRVADGTVSATKSLFYRQIKTLHLDIRAREAINTSAAGIPLSVVVRIYQLKDNHRSPRSRFRRKNQRLSGRCHNRRWLRKMRLCRSLNPATLPVRRFIWPANPDLRICPFVPVISINLTLK